MVVDVAKGRPSENSKHEKAREPFGEDFAGLSLGVLPRRVYTVWVIQWDNLMSWTFTWAGMV